MDQGYDDGLALSIRTSHEISCIPYDSRNPAWKKVIFSRIFTLLFTEENIRLNGLCSQQTKFIPARKLCYDRETARCRCNIGYLVVWYASKFTAASRGSPWDSTAFLFLFIWRTLIARDSIICYSAYMLSPVRPSVCLSVTRVDQSKALEVRIMQLSPSSSPMTLVSSWLTSPRNSKGNIGSEGAK